MKYKLSFMGLNFLASNVKKTTYRVCAFIQGAHSYGIVPYLCDLVIRLGGGFASVVASA
jgi:hypothetical protein